MSRDLIASVPVDLPDGRRVRVLAYADGGLRFRVSDSPYTIAEAFISGRTTDHTIIRIDPPHGTWPRPVTTSQSITDDPNCPQCGTPNSCKKHRWAYRTWWDNFRAGVSK